ncbi:hypothetical protein KY361_02250 [Candidatus Woesearchaeota archaeon]|nr:hypothetical protein [Candidatus Woesearchaeota archaeon]
MKKTIALVLAMLMVFSVVPLAFAQEEPGTGDPPECVADEDCEEGEVCTDGECEAAEPPPECVADEDCEEGEVCTDGECEAAVPPPPEDPGVTPDSPLYGLDRAIERVELALTLGKSAKAKKGLAHARERLMEVQAMIAAKKMGAAARAQGEHDDIMDDVEDAIDDLGDGDAGDEFSDEIEIEQALNQHRMLVQQLNNVKVMAKGLTAEQQAQLDAVVASLEGATESAKVKVQVKKDRTKIKIKAAAGLTDEELASLEEQAQAIAGQGKEVKINLKPKKGRGTPGAEEPEEPAEGEEPEEPEEGEEGAGAASAAAKGKDKSSKGKNK